MPVTSRIAGCALALVLALSGCRTEYDFTPPQTAEGLACVGACSDREQECFAAHSRQDEAAYASCQRGAQSEYESCVKQASDPGRCYVRVCQRQLYAAGCEDAYRTGYRNCGGTVEVRK